MVLENFVRSVKLGFGVVTTGLALSLGGMGCDDMSPEAKIVIGREMMKSDDLVTRLQGERLYLEGLRDQQMAIAQAGKPEPDKTEVNVYTDREGERKAVRPSETRTYVVPRRVEEPRKEPRRLIIPIHESPGTREWISGTTELMPDPKKTTPYSTLFNSNFYGNIRNIRIHKNTWEDREKGTLIHTEIAVQSNSRDGFYQIGAYFFKENGRILRDRDKKYRCENNGQVCTMSDEFRSSSGRIQMFIPDAQLGITRRGEHNLKFYVSLFSFDPNRPPKEIQRSNWIPFTYRIK